MEDIELRWYYYYSWWIFIWFIFFKIGILNYSPYITYILVIIYLSIKSIQQIPIFNDIIKNYFKKPDLNLRVIIYWFIIVLFIDILPFFLLERDFDKKTVFLNGLLFLIYILFMESKNISILNHYSISKFKKIINNYTGEEFLEGIFKL